MNEDTRQLDLALAECEQENRLLRARNERLVEEAKKLRKVLDEVGNALLVYGPDYMHGMGKSHYIKLLAANLGEVQ